MNAMNDYCKAGKKLERRTGRLFKAHDRYQEAQRQYETAFAGYLLAYNRCVEAGYYPGYYPKNYLPKDYL